MHSPITEANKQAVGANFLRAMVASAPWE